MPIKNTCKLRIIKYFKIQNVQKKATDIFEYDTSKL